MKVIRPTAVTDAMLVSSTLVENDYPAWASGTAYAKGDYVIRTSTHTVYQALAAVAAGGSPPESNSAAWLAVGPTNRWKMFDQSVGTVSTAANSFTVTLAPGSIDSIGLVDIAGLTATVTMKMAGTVIWTRTLATSASGRVINGWYDWFFAPRGTRTTLIFEDVPIQPTATIDVTVDAGSGTAGLGTLIVGRELDLGSTEAGVKVGLLDFSTKTTDAFGVTSVVQRAWSKQMTLRTLTYTKFVDVLQRELAKLRATPALWIGEDGFDSLAIYGFYKDFSLDLALANISYCSLTIEGLT